MIFLCFIPLNDTFIKAEYQMTVFISYRHTDRDKALAINEKLKRENIPTYLDVLDPESQTTDDITSIITRNIVRCTHLIAVISSATTLSWWVPFEIGEATITERRIASYKTGYGELPEYLKKWPQMTSDAHLDLFIKTYNGDRTIAMEGLINQRYSKETNKNNAENFHSDLRNKIMRGY